MNGILARAGRNTTRAGWIRGKKDVCSRVSALAGQQQTKQHGQYRDGTGARGSVGGFAMHEEQYKGSPRPGSRPVDGKPDYSGGPAAGFLLSRCRRSASSVNAGPDAA